ncbi:hypothetical protein ACTXJG_13010 [Glutamicibacter arilaitensis]|uniref:hypothetical protein n=1 Tax=Glutamicibacter arilaitensis TaxID=256701 RepID=UPI003FD457C6
MQNRTRNIKKHSSRGRRVFEDLDSAIQAGLSDGLTIIKSNGRYFDYYFEDRGSSVTLVTFHAAIGPNTVEYPIFTGSRFAEKLNVNLLAFADAACGGAEKLLTFWHQSTKRVPSGKIIPQIIDLTQRTGHEKHLIFFGSSAGGYAALHYSTFFPNSVSMVMNPRIELLGKPHRFNEYSQRAYPGWEPETVARKIPTSMSNWYSKGRENTVFYLQNSGDKVYYNNHYSPFEAATRGQANIHFKIHNWGNGHIVPPANEYMDPLESLVEHAPNWKSAITHFTK